MAHLDHLVFASPDLDEGMRHIASATDAEAVHGGPHPGMGTRNALLGFDRSALGSGAYFEIIAFDPEQPDPPSGRPFDLDNAAPLTLVSFAIAPDDGETLADVGAMFQDHGFDPGPAAAMSRDKPDGTTISWKLTIPFGSGQRALPFLIDWGDTPHPSTDLPSMGELQQLIIGEPDPAVRSCLEALNLGVTVVSAEVTMFTAVVDDNAL